MAKIKFRTAIQKLQRIRDNLPVIIGNEAVNFTQENFKKQRFQNNGELKWKARKPNRDSKRRSKRGVLIDTGRLFRSIRIIQKTSTSVRIGTDVPYAKIHNQGGKVSSTQGVRKHKRTRKGNTHSVKSHSRKMDFTMPKRKFLGKSRVLNRRATRHIIKLIKKTLR